MIGATIEQEAETGMRNFIGEEFWGSNPGGLAHAKHAFYH